LLLSPPVCLRMCFHLSCLFLSPPICLRMCFLCPVRLSVCFSVRFICPDLQEHVLIILLITSVFLCIFPSFLLSACVFFFPVCLFMFYFSLSSCCLFPCGVSVSRSSRTCCNYFVNNICMVFPSCLSSYFYLFSLLSICLFVFLCIFHVLTIKNTF